MGLAAVLFGTAQVHGDPKEYKIQVKERREGEVKRCYSIEIKREFGGENFGCIEFVWDGDKLTSLGGGDLTRDRASYFLLLKKGRPQGVQEKSSSSFWYSAPFFVRGRDYGCFFTLAFYCELVVRADRKGKDIREAFLTVRDQSGWNLCAISDIPVYVGNIREAHVIADYYDKSKLPDWALERCSSNDCCGLIPWEHLEYIAKRAGTEGKYRLEEGEQEESGCNPSYHGSDESEDEGFSYDEDFSYGRDSRSNLSRTVLSTQDRIKALFEEDKARREKDPEREKERRMREESQIRACNRIRELIRMDLESRKIKEANKIEKNEIILEEPKVEDKKEEKLFNKSSKEDYFKGFDAFKDKLNAEFKAHFEKENSGKNEIKIGDKKSKEPEIFKSEDCFGFPESRFEFSEVMNSKPIKIEYKEERDKESFEEEEDEKEDVKIGQSEINFEKSPVESICNESSENSEKSEHRGKLLKYTSDSDDE